MNTQGAPVKRVVIPTEKIALSTCLELVRTGKVFSVERVGEGWLFEVVVES